MPVRDLPDWHMLNSQKTVFEVTDLGELAVRLGAISRFDRGGDAIVLEDFESGLNKWATSAGGTGAAVRLSTIETRSGLFACKMIAGSDSSRLARIVRSSPFVPTSNVGLEMSIDIDGDLEKWELALELYTGTQILRGTLRYVAASEEVQIEGPGAVFTTVLTGLALGTGASLFHSAKMVLNPDTAMYLRATINDQVLAVSTTGLFSLAGAVTPRLAWTTLVVGDAGANAVCYVDDMILTQNEPT